MAAATTSLVLVSLLAGCAGSDDPGADHTPGEPGMASADGAADAALARPQTERPAEKVLVVEVEGTPEETRVVLFRAPADFPLPFSTYVPEDMIAEPAAAGGADEVRFVANFGGYRNDAAAVRLLVAGAGATEEELVATLRDVARELGTELVPETERRFGWSVREYRSVAPGSRHAVAEGIMAIGRRDGRTFALVLHNPAEYGDGFGPRAGVILDEWRWAGTAEPLRR